MTDRFASYVTEEMESQRPRYHEIRAYREIRDDMPEICFPVYMEPADDSETTADVTEGSPVSADADAAGVDL